MVHNENVNEVYIKHFLMQLPQGGEIMKIYSINSIKLNDSYKVNNISRLIAFRSNSEGHAAAKNSDVAEFKSDAKLPVSENFAGKKLINHPTLLEKLLNNLLNSKFPKFLGDEQQPVLDRLFLY